MNQPQRKVAGRLWQEPPTTKEWLLASLDLTVSMRTTMKFLYPRPPAKKLIAQWNRCGTASTLLTKQILSVFWDVDAEVKVWNNSTLKNAVILERSADNTEQLVSGIFILFSLLDLPRTQSPRFY